MTNPKDYLGDSVYAEFDGYYLVLTTNNGYEDDPRNKIALEPTVYSELLRFVKRLKTPQVPNSKVAGLIERQEADHRHKISLLQSASRILDKVPEAILEKVTTFGRVIDFNNLTREESLQVISALNAGKWEKSINDAYPDKIDYQTTIDGVMARLWAAAPPDSCRVVEVEEIIPEQRVMKRKLICSEPKAI